MSLKFVFHSCSSIGTALLSSYLDEYINKNAKYKGLAMTYFSPILIYALSCIYACIYSKLLGKSMSLSKRNIFLNFLCGFVFAVQVFLGQYSLKFMSYPLKIVFTSAKLLISMPTTAAFRMKKKKVPGTFLGYTLKEYIVSLGIFVGILLVLLPNSKKQPPLKANTAVKTNAFDFKWKGVICSIVSSNLACVFDELQTLMLAENPLKPGTAPSNEVVLAWNMLSSVLFLSAGIFFNGLAGDVKKIIVDDRRTLYLGTAMGVMNVLTQVVLILLKKNYGTWWKNIISSFRKCMSIIVSIFLFRHPVTALQVFGIIFVIANILMAGQIEMNRGKDKGKGEKGPKKKKKKQTVQKRRERRLAKEKEKEEQRKRLEEEEEEE